MITPKTRAHDETKKRENTTAAHTNGATWSTLVIWLWRWQREKHFTALNSNAAFSESFPVSFFPPSSILKCKRFISCHRHSTVLVLALSQWRKNKHTAPVHCIYVSLPFAFESSSASLSWCAQAKEMLDTFPRAICRYCSFGCMFLQCH